jgi:hypothetical protein
MRNSIIFLFSCLFSAFSFSQIQGDLARAGRSLTHDASFVLESKYNGKIVFDVAVLNTGEISGIKFNPGESTIKSTPAQIQARKYIADWKFEPGTHFPKFHQARIIITMVKPL